MLELAYSSMFSSLVSSPSGGLAQVWLRSCGSPSTGSRPRGVVSFADVSSAAPLADDLCFCCCAIFCCFNRSRYLSNDARSGVESRGSLLGHGWGQVSG